VVSLSLDTLYTWINTAFLPFVRLLAMFSLAPVFGESSLPKRVKIALAALTAILIAPLVSSDAAGAPALSPASWPALWLSAQQLLIGLSLGLVMRMAFTAVHMAGELVGLQMGLSFASFFDPATSGNTAVLARLMNMLALLIFLSLDGHLLLLQGLVASFEVLPITLADPAVAHAAPGFAVNGWAILFVWSAQILASGLLLALPLVMTLLCISLALGILNRTAQQLSVFSVGFPISLLVGLVLLMTLLPQLAPPLTRLFHQALQTLWELAQALGSG